MKVWASTTDLPLFDQAESIAAADRGINAAASHNATLLVEAREVARELAKGGRAISADDVVEGMMRRGYGVHCLGNAAGSLFRTRGWRATGERVKSKRIHAHANDLRLWIWIGE